MSDRKPERSDQLPEEGPAEQVPDDGGGAEDKNDRPDSGSGGQGSGGADEVERQATGNPDNAG